MDDRFTLEKAEIEQWLGKMAIKDLKAPPRAGKDPLDRTAFDYTHILTPEARDQGYRLRIRELRAGSLLVHVYATDPARNLNDDPVGQAIAGRHERDPDAFSVQTVHLDGPDLAKKLGLGTAMYEAAYAHAYHHMGMRKVRGEHHSSMAHRTHERLAARHGLEYEAQPAFGSRSAYDPDARKHRYPTAQDWQKAPNEPFDEKYGQYEYALKSEGDLTLKNEPDLCLQEAEEMAGYQHHAANAFDAARLIAGSNLCTLDQFRSALHKHDGDLELAALEAYRLPIDDPHLRSLRGVMAGAQLSKSEPLASLRVPDIQPAHPDATTAAEEVRRAFTEHAVQEVRLNGKHSQGSQVAKDPETGHIYLLKPGSGDASPAAGVTEEKASQSRREAAFWHVADTWGIGEFMPRADLLLIDGREVATIRMLAFSYKNLGTRTKQKPQLLPGALRGYAYAGMLHKWAVIDYVLGNPDRHSQNLMIDQDDRTVRLIDHGSAFAGKSFDPAHDPNSFIPFYLRAFTSLKFSQMADREKALRMPRAGTSGERILSEWINRLDPKRLESTLQHYGIDADPALARLALIKMLPEPKDEAINRLWAEDGDVG